MSGNFLKELKLETVYAWLAVPIGLIFLFLMPPFQVPDEGAHYFKALNLAQGQMMCSEQVSAPVNYVSLPSDTQLVKIRGEERKKVSGTKIKEALMTAASAEKTPVPFSVCGASPVGYITQALGLKIGISASAPPLVAFYMGRLLTLIVAIALIYFAIRVAPFGKIIFLFVGLLPMAVQQIASFSYDALHIGLVLFFIAYLLRLTASPEKISQREMSWLFILSLLAFNAKQGYFLLALLVFVLPGVKFPSVKKYWIYTIGFVILNIAVFLFSRMLFSEVSAFGKGIDPNAQLWGVLKNPVGFIYIVFHSLYKGFFFYFETFFLKPGWINTGLPDLLYMFMAVGMVLILRSKDEIVSLNMRQRLILLGVFFAQFFLVFLSMYLVWTKVGSGRIDGVQGRYFLAIAPLLIFSFYKSKFTFRSEWIRNNIQITLIVFLLIAFVFVFRNLVQLYYKGLANYF